MPFLVRFLLVSYGLPQVFAESELAEFYFPELASVLSKVDLGSPLLAERREQVQEAKANQLIASSMAGIKAGFNFQGQSVQEDRPSYEFQSHERFFSALLVRKPLFHWGALKAEQRKSQIASEQAELNLSVFRKQVRSELRVKYLDLVLRKFQMKLAFESLKNAKKGEANCVSRLTLGLVTDLAVAEATAVRIQHEISLADLRRTFDYEIAMFSHLTNSDEKLDCNQTSSFIELCQNHSFQSSKPQLISKLSSADIDRIRLQIRIEEQNLKVANSARLPKFDLVGIAYQDQIPSVDFNDKVNRNNLIVGLEANWSLWDSHLSKGQKESAQSRKRKYRLEVKRHLEELRMNVTNLYKELTNLTRMIELNRKLVEVAIKRYEKSLIQFDENNITAYELDQAMIALNQAKISRTQSVINHLKIRDRYLQMLNYASE